MDYALAKQLKDSGFPYEWCNDDSPCLIGQDDVSDCFPTLSELIEACGAKNFKLTIDTFGESNAYSYIYAKTGKGKTPEEAVANLWLELNKK